MYSITQSEEDLLRLLSNGDESAFHVLYSIYHQQIYNLGVKIFKSKQLAEDLTQDVFVKVWINKEKLRDIGNFEFWIRAIARNQAYNYLKRVAQEQLILRGGNFQNDTNGTPIESYINFKEFGVLLKQAIERLPPQQRKIYLFSRQDGLKLHEIAEMTGLSINTVKNHMKAALSSIRIFFDGYFITWLIFLDSINFFWTD